MGILAGVIGELIKKYTMGYGALGLVGMYSQWYICGNVFTKIHLSQ